MLNVDLYVKTIKCGEKITIGILVYVFVKMLSVEEVLLTIC